MNNVMKKAMNNAETEVGRTLAKKQGIRYSLTYEEVK